jgi:beta-lactamase class A
MAVTRRVALGWIAAAALRGADDFERLLEGLAAPLGAELGFAMRHFESGEFRSVRGGERFPMASVYKLPIAIEILSQIDEGKLSLGQTVHLSPADLRLGLGNKEVERLVGTTGRDFTLKDLLARTLLDSDNTSSDALLRLAGAGAVTRRMAALGSPEIRVDRPEYTLLLDYVGVSAAPPESGWSLDELRGRYQSAGLEQRKHAQRAFLADPRDTATPNAMVDLLSGIHRREILQPTSMALLLDWMARCHTGADRLRAHIPETVTFQHRTGTTDTTGGLTAATNDVGILELPQGAGHVAIAAFLRMARGTVQERESVLGRIGRAVFERYFGARRKPVTAVRPPRPGAGG